MVMAENTCEDVPNGQFRFEDGELVLSDNEPNLEGKGESEDASNSKKSRRKQTFERRNIKETAESIQPPTSTRHSEWLGFVLWIHGRVGVGGCPKVDDAHRQSHENQKGARYNGP
ncbi:hypothetical protein CRM22_006244 [Opisthorchis felineus]|uniref:Uncharacterized protein n=1 Tax=Opisthorchis felineus TaxID=147828 RepID=A0A4S2LT83_OPIFE|nr:hypothetical protein CRM22_006244 [Opisthorchis felineus]